MKDPKHWCQFFIEAGLINAQRLIEDKGPHYRFCFGDEVTMADAFLLPQLAAARKFHVDLSDVPLLLEKEQHLYNDVEVFRKVKVDTAF